MHKQKILNKTRFALTELE